MENLDSTNSEKQDPKAKESENLDSTNSEKAGSAKAGSCAKLVASGDNINREGEIVIEPQFDDGKKFSGRVGSCANRWQLGIYQPRRKVF